MISSIFAYLWLLKSPAGSVSIAEPNATPIPIGRTITHLRSFFDARALGAGEPVYPVLLALAPRMQMRMVAGEFASSPNFNLIDLAGAIKMPVLGQPTPISSAPSAKAPAAPTRNQLQSHVASAPGKPVAAKTVALNEPTAPVTSKGSPEDKTVTLNVVSAPLSMILNLIMDQTGANLLMIGDHKDTITLRIRQRRFIDALDDICASTELKWLKVGNTYVFGDDAKLKSAYHDAYLAAHPEPAPMIQLPPQIVTETYHTNYCDANKLIAALKDPLKDSGLTLIAAPASPSPQLSEQDESSKSGVASSVLDKDENADKISRLIVLQGPQASVDSALILMKKLDISPAQVNIGVTINDLTITGEKDLGIDWGASSTTSLTENQPSGIGFASFTRSPLSFQATLNYLQSKGEDKLLASPNITVLDGQRAYILVGQRLEFPIISSIQQNGQPLYNVDEERVGIYLQVSVWVSNDGKVKLQLYPQVSTVTSFISVNGGQYPQISTREAQTTLTVESGHTILIGGLIHDEDIVNMSKVPILSQIPILGELFTNRDHQKTRDEVVISITPTISNNP